MLANCGLLERLKCCLGHIRLISQSAVEDVLKIVKWTMKYRELISYALHYDFHTDLIMVMRVNSMEPNLRRKACVALT